MKSVHVRQACSKTKTVRCGQGERDRGLRARLTNGMAFPRLSSAPGLLPVQKGSAKPAGHGTDTKTVSTQGVPGSDTTPEAWGTNIESSVLMFVTRDCREYMRRSDPLLSI